MGLIEDRSASSIFENDPSSMKLSVHSAMLAGGGRPGPPGPLCIPKPESAEREDTRPVV